MIDEYLPRSVNQGPWVTAYTLNELRERMKPTTSFVLPICSFDTPYSQCASLGELVLPPLYHEALDDQLKSAIVGRIKACFPAYGEDNAAKVRVIELPRSELPNADSSTKLLAFSVDTAVEEHGPHLPLATDTIQSYSVLNQLADEIPQIEVCRPVEYGQLTWGLPFGFSVDLTAELLSQYVARYTTALTQWKNPRSIYVVDVHGSINHRGAIVEGLKSSGFTSWTFRWLHEPLAEFASQRGDQHAGGVETALVERVSPQLLDARWWPQRIEAIAQGQMSFQQAVELTPELDSFVCHVHQNSLNGVIGDIRNYHALNADDLFQRMMSVARRDVDRLLRGDANQTAGEELW